VIFSRSQLCTSGKRRDEKHDPFLARLRRIINE
jgi:hypothetical protein